MNVDAEVGISLAEREHLHGRISQGQIDYLREVQSSIVKRLLVFFASSNSRRKEFMAKEGGAPAKAFLTERLVEKVSEGSRDGHRWLVENFDLPLEQYGYPL